MFCVLRYQNKIKKFWMHRKHAGTNCCSRVFKGGTTKEVKIIKGWGRIETNWDEERRREANRVKERQREAKREAKSKVKVTDEVSLFVFHIPEPSFV